MGGDIRLETCTSGLPKLMVIGIKKVNEVGSLHSRRIEVGELKWEIPDSSLLEQAEKHAARVAKRLLAKKARGLSSGMLGNSMGSMVLYRVLVTQRC